MPPSWDDLSLPLAELTQLKQLSAGLKALRSRSPATRYGPNPWAASEYLFCGPSGTDKALAAQLIAGELGVAMWKIPSAALVKGYTGRTKKNLDRVFDRAGTRGWLLFFDEADALFGKRTGVSSHNSRYADQEISHLLRQAEGYRGVVILSTQAKPVFTNRLMGRFEGSVEFS